GMIDQQPSVLGTLQAANVDALQAGHSVVTGLFHHKYAVVDGATDVSDPLVITGSHNWSSAAENDNDENTLIIHSGDVARQYVQEFSERYHESGGVGPVLGVKQTGSTVPRTTTVSQNYPNPFNPTTNFEMRIAKTGFVTLKVFDVLGREVATILSETKSPGVYTVTWDASKLASGVYLYRMQSGGVLQTRKMILLR
ncbi:MAG TPA: phospholipase D-like domain-containing protein, partial [Terriglobia bacterium]|nr:phospholipase D-like domain-containing protein [Terriglobia bacterium]